MCFEHKRELNNFDIFANTLEGREPLQVAEQWDTATEYLLLSEVSGINDKRDQPNSLLLPLIGETLQQSFNASALLHRWIL